uniref:Uncharacterized protein n=1 Tax=Schistosoma mansoni TaxID=6183 RepID=A0A5K4F351_SCHMA
MDYLNIRSVTDSKKLFIGYSIFHPDSYIANKRKYKSTYNESYHRLNDLMNFQHNSTEYNLNGTTTITTTSTTTTNNNISSLSYPITSMNIIHSNQSLTTPISIKIHQNDKHINQHDLDHSMSDICSTNSSSLSDHTTNGINYSYPTNSLSLSLNKEKRKENFSNTITTTNNHNSSYSSVCFKHRTLPLVPNSSYEYQHNYHNTILTSSSSSTSTSLSSSQFMTPMVTWRIKDSKEIYYDKKLLRLIEQLPNDKQNSIGLILLAMDVKLFNYNINKSTNTTYHTTTTNNTTHNTTNTTDTTNNSSHIHYSDIFSGGLEYRLREALQLIQPKNKMMNDLDHNHNPNSELNKSYLNKIIDVRSRKNLNESKKPPTNFAKESPKEDGRESGIDPDTLDETSTSMIGNSLSLNDMKCTTNDISNTTEANKPSVITILRRLARYLALRIANKRHSLATANQHVARNAIEEKLLRSRLSELNIDYHHHHPHHDDHLVNSWNSFNSMEINYGTIVNRFDRLHNNTIAVIQLLCQLARRLAILDGQLYCLNKNQYNDNVILLCNSNNDPLLPYNHYTTSLTNDTPKTISNHLLNDFNDKDNDNDDWNSQCELSQIIEQQKRLIIQIKEAQLLRAELETCRHRLLESIPAHIKCDITHNIIDKLGRDFMNDNQLTPATTTTTSNNTTDKTTFKQNITQLKLTSSYTTSKELEQSFNDQQSIMNTTQFLRQRVTEHLIEFLNWFVLSQIFETEIKVDQDLWENIQDELRFELSY